MFHLMNPPTDTLNRHKHRYPFMICIYTCAHIQIHIQTYIQVHTHIHTPTCLRYSYTKAHTQCSHIHTFFHIGLHIPTWEMKTYSYFLFGLPSAFLFLKKKERKKKRLSSPISPKSSIKILWAAKKYSCKPKPQRTTNLDYDPKNPP